MSLTRFYWTIRWCSRDRCTVPAYYVGGKLFASLHMDGVCVNSSTSLEDELLTRDGIEPFESMGRRMREWMPVNRARSEDYRDDEVSPQHRSNTSRRWPAWTTRKNN